MTGMKTSAGTTQYNTTRTVSNRASENAGRQVVPNVGSSLNKKRERDRKKPSPLVRSQYSFIAQMMLLREDSGIK